MGWIKLSHTSKKTTVLIPKAHTHMKLLTTHADFKPQVLVPLIQDSLILHQKTKTLFNKPLPQLVQFQLPLMPVTHHFNYTNLESITNYSAHKPVLTTVFSLLVMVLMVEKTTGSLKTAGAQHGVTKVTSK